MDQRRLTQAVWRLLALLVLLPALVQGGTPRLPTLAILLTLSALLAGWAVTWVRAPRREFSLTRLDGICALFLFWALFSMLFSPYYHPAEQAFLLIFCYVSLYWILVFHPSFTGLETALTAVRLQGLLQAVIVLSQRYGAGLPRPGGTFFNPNFLAGFLAAAIVLSLGAIVFPPAGRGARRPLAVAARGGETVILLAALLLTGSRGGIFALAAGLLVLLGLRAWKVAIAAGLAGTASLFLIPNPWIERLQTLHRADVFAWTRFAIWKSAWTMMIDHPWIGVGLGQFEFISPRYAFPISGHWARFSRVAENAHSEYLQIGAEMGVVGLLLLLAGLAALVLGVRRGLRSRPARERADIVPLFAGLVAVLAHALVDFNLHTPPAALLLVIFAAGLRIHGVTGEPRVVEFRFRPVYGVLVGMVVLGFTVAAVRPVIGFAYFLRGIGAPVNLLREKWALEEAPRRDVPSPEASELIGKAARIDFICAPYHRALGSLHFQNYLRGRGGEEDRHKALYHLNFAAQLNPNNYQYFANLGQAMTSLARRAPPGLDYLQEAVRNYEQAAKIAPRRFGIYQEIGKLQDELGKPEAAERNFRLAVEIEEYNLRGWHDLGIFYARNGRTGEARAAFRRGAELAVKARALVPTSDGERELIALEPAVFYNEIKKLDQSEKSGTAS